MGIEDEQTKPENGESNPRTTTLTHTARALKKVRKNREAIRRRKLTYVPPAHASHSRSRIGVTLSFSKVPATHWGEAARHLVCAACGWYSVMPLHGWQSRSLVGVAGLAW